MSLPDRVPEVAATLSVSGTGAAGDGVNLQA